MNWETMSSPTGDSFLRAKIFGGWLVTATSDVRSAVNIGYSTPDYQTGYEWRTSITFVPDPNHEWDLNKTY